MPFKTVHLIAGQTTAKKDMIVWKKALSPNTKSGKVVVKLRIPKGTKINLRTGPCIEDRKCRAKEAEVIGFYNCKGKKITPKEVHSRHLCHFQYITGKKLLVKDFDTTTEICAEGIHFFIKETDARKYNFT